MSTKVGRVESEQPSELIERWNRLADEWGRLLDDVGDVLDRLEADAEAAYQPKHLAP